MQGVRVQVSKLELVTAGKLCFILVALLVPPRVDYVNFNPCVQTMLSLTDALNVLALKKVCTVLKTSKCDESKSYCTIIILVTFWRQLFPIRVQVLRYRSRRDDYFFGDRY